MKRPFNLNLLLALGGGAILALLLYRLGLSAVAQQLWLVGWGWLLIIGQEILPILANTGGWLYAFPAPERTVKFWPLLKMRLAGDSANYLVPSATVGGEILRISLLRGNTSVPVGAASVTLAKFTQFLGQALFIALGLLLAAPFAPLKPGLLPWLWVVLAGCLVFLGLIPMLTLIGSSIYGVIYFITRSSDVAAGLGMGFIAGAQWLTGGQLLSVAFIVVMLLLIPLKKSLDKPRRAAIQQQHMRSS